MLISLLGVLYLLIFERSLSLGHILYGVFSWPAIAGVFYDLFDCISLKAHKRPFYLYAKGSDDVVGLGFKKNNPHFKFSDRLFSLILIFIWLSWPIIYIVIYKLFST
ncbi:hypothetical protein GCM10027348_08270 [Hymenobacter tenuis]